jgi:hypothetical protein
MTYRGTSRSRAIAMAVIAALVAGSSHSALDAQATPSPTTAAAAPTAIDGGWPRAYVSRAGAQIVIYQPQVASWDGRRQMVAYAAVAYQPANAAKPTLGTIAVEAATTVSLEERLVKFSPLQISQASFGTLSRDQLRDLIAEIDASIPEDDRIIALDRVLAGVDKSQILPKNVDRVKADPPRIFYSTKPAVLVNFDGEPIWSPIKDNDLTFAVNTNWDVFQLERTGTYYLRHESRWLKASNVNGPWSNAASLPDSFAKLPDDGNWTEVKAALRPPSGAVAAAASVFVSTQPAELLLLRGEPEYVPVPGTQLFWVSNADNDVFRLGKTGPVYYLVSGRWFSALSFNGPWSFVTPTLPPDFKRISLEHPRSRVLASVPGTPQAAEAVLLAQVPQTARVNRKTLQPPEVMFQGDPVFDPVEGTLLARAVNTDKDIIKVGDLYYMCFQGVWFMGGSPSGPWQVASSVPGAIYEIPASSPAHHVTYVTVDNSDDDWVTFAAVAGYSGMMVGWGCAVWGTGWYYPPYVRYGGFYPVYYPFYPSYGYGAWYNPWTGGYGRGAAWYGPYGGAGVYAPYKPSTGTYARGAVA